MHTVLFNESFFFCSRDGLERLQPLSQTLLDMIVAGSNVLPLRPIHRVDMDSDDSEDSIQIFVAKPVVDEDADEPRPDYKASVRDGNFKEAFLRLQNTCIKEFCFGIRYSPFLRYWKAQEPAVFTVVSIYFSHANDADCGVLDSIVNHVRPRVVHIYAPDNTRWHKKGILDRDSFLHNVQSCRLSVGRDAFPPSSFILKEPGYPNYEVCCDRSNVAGGVDDFIESFVRNGCANKKLESVWVRWIERDDGPQSPASKRLSKLTKVDMPLPENDLTTRLSGEAHRVSHCEMQSFENTMQWKRMDVYKWSVEYDDDDGRHTANFLHFRVKNL